MPGPDIISSSYFGVGNFESYKLPAIKVANGIIINDVFYPWQMKRWTKSAAGGMGYLLTVEPGKAYYIRDMWWQYLSGADQPVVRFSFYDYAAGFKEYWNTMDFVMPSIYSKQYYKINMLMPPSMQFTHTFDNELLALSYQELSLWFAIVPSIIQVEDKKPKPGPGQSGECHLLDWIEDKCYPPVI